MSWPNDADGDVFRMLSAEGFDFSSQHVIEFNVDFQDWPPAQKAVDLLNREFQNVRVVEPDAEDLADGEFAGYVVFELLAKLSYELVIETQLKATTLMAQYNARCDSWGVLYGKPH